MGGSIKTSVDRDETTYIVNIGLLLTDCKTDRVKHKESIHYIMPLYKDGQSQVCK
jgi:hypothetical protein